MRVLFFMQRQRLHIPVIGFKRLLKFFLDRQRPVEIKSVPALLAEFTHLFNARLHFPRHLYRIIDNNFITPLCFTAQRPGNELIDFVEIFFRAGRSGQDQWKRNVMVFRMQQNAEKIQYFFRRPHAAGEHDNAMTAPHKRFKTFFNIRHDDQIIHDRVG